MQGGAKMKHEYIIEEGPKRDFAYKGEWYTGYIREYNTGDFDVEVFPRGKEEEQADGDVYEYAWDLFEDLGLFNKGEEK